MCWATFWAIFSQSHPGRVARHSHSERNLIGMILALHICTYVNVLPKTTRKGSFDQGDQIGRILPFLGYLFTLGSFSSII
jgi:hypothetical protein